MYLSTPDGTINRLQPFCGNFFRVRCFFIYAADYKTFQSTALQSKKVVPAYLQSKQILPFVALQQYHITKLNMSRRDFTV